MKTYKELVEATRNVSMKQQWKNKVKEVHGKNVKFETSKETDRYSKPTTYAYNEKGDMVGYHEHKSGRSIIDPKVD